MSLLSWLKKNTARDDAWITVHPNAGGKGSPVLLDDEGYIKGGMGGKFTGQRIDLMPRQTIHKASNNTPVSQRISRYNLKNGTKREQLQHIFRGVKDPAKNEEAAIAFYNAPDDFLLAINNSGGEIDWSTIKNSDRAYAQWGNVYIGDKYKESRNAIAKDMPPEMYSVNSHDGTLRHEYGHAIDMRTRNLFDEGMDNKGWQKFHASSQSKLFVDAVKSAQKDLVTKVNGSKQMNPEIAEQFGYSKSNFGDYYVRNGKPLGPLAKCAPISDIVSALSGGSLSGEFSHSDAYWRKGGMGARRTEIFANLTNIYTSGDKELWAQTERIFPSLTKAYTGLLKEINGKGAAKE